MDEKIIEISERVAKGEANILNLIKSVTDHLVQWDRQWIKIDDMEKRITLAEPRINSFAEQAKKIETLEKYVSKVESEKNVWKNILSPIFSILSAVVSSWLTFKLLK
jgi:hypothetical protein